MQEQFDLQLGKLRQTKGMALSETSLRAQYWKVKATRWFRDLPVGMSFCADDCRRAIGLPSRGSNKNNAVGAFISGMSRKGWIQFTGKFVNSHAVDRHAGSQRVWIKL